MSAPVLPFVPFSRADESPISVIQRAAKENGFKNVDVLFGYLGQFRHKPILGNCLLAHSGVSRSLQSCAPDYANLIQASFYMPSRPLIRRCNAFVKGIEIQLPNLRSQEYALCTACKQEGYENFPKDIKLFSNCPFHNCEFLFFCPFCGNKTNWKCQLSDICECGNQLQSPKISPAKMAQEHYLLSLFAQRDHTTMASIQRVLAKLERETRSSDETVIRARRTLAIAVGQKDIAMIIDAIHRCLPSSTIDEVDLSLSLIRSELSHPMIIDLRQKLVSSFAEQKTPVAEFTLSLGVIRRYVGISETCWYAIKRSHDLFKGNGRGAKATFKEALEIKKTVLNCKHTKAELARAVGKSRQRQALSTSDVRRLTDIPDKAIEYLALNSKLFGIRGYNARQLERGEVLSFSWSAIDAFNQQYVCSHRLSREWHIPISDINRAIVAHKLQPGKFRSLNETKIIAKRFIHRLQYHLTTGPDPKRWTHLAVPIVKLTAGYLTSKECEALLSIPTRSIQYLIKKGIIPCNCKSAKGHYLVNKEDAAEFRAKHFFISDLSKLLNIPGGLIAQTLANSGILPTSGPLIDDGQIHIYAKNSIPPATIKSIIRKTKYSSSRRPAQDKSNDKNTFCVDVNLICKKYSFSRKLLSKYFLMTGLINHTERKGKKYTTIQESERIFRILDNYMSVEQAAKILHVSTSSIRELFTKKKLAHYKPSHLPDLNPGFISNSQLDELQKILSDRL